MIQPPPFMPPQDKEMLYSTLTNRTPNQSEWETRIFVHRCQFHAVENKNREYNKKCKTQKTPSKVMVAD